VAALKEAPVTSAVMKNGRGELFIPDYIIIKQESGLVRVQVLFYFLLLMHERNYFTRKSINYQ